ncbi:CPXCG motif-containing cysteine-rich protein [Bizionia sp. KMM 8389]
MLEHYFQCPYCWERISMLLDRSQPEHVYIEDCEVCCNPIEISVGFANTILNTFEVRSIE